MKTMQPELLHTVLRLDAATGKLYWRHRDAYEFPTPAQYKRWASALAGREAFTAIGAGGYKVGRVFGITLLAHRVVFALHSNRWPAGVVDHIDRRRDNNIPSNLRDVSHKVNSRNCRPFRRKVNKHGLPGLSRSRNKEKWVLHRTVDGKSVYVGTYDTKADAAMVLAHINMNVNR